MRIQESTALRPASSSHSVRRWRSRQQTPVNGGAGTGYWSGGHHVDHEAVLDSIRRIHRWAEDRNRQTSPAPQPAPHPPAVAAANNDWSAGFRLGAATSCCGLASAMLVDGVFGLSAAPGGQIVTLAISVVLALVSALIFASQTQVPPAAPHPDAGPDRRSSSR